MIFNKIHRLWTIVLQFITRIMSSERITRKSRFSRNCECQIKLNYLQAVEPHSLQRPENPSQQCFQQPEPHLVTSAGVSEPGKKNWGGLFLSGMNFSFFLLIDVAENFKSSKISLIQKTHSLSWPQPITQKRLTTS